MMKNRSRLFPRRKRVSGVEKKFTSLLSWSVAPTFFSLFPYYFYVGGNKNFFNIGE
jgi:hypothetical protein